MRVYVLAHFVADEEVKEIWYQVVHTDRRTVFMKEPGLPQPCTCTDRDKILTQIKERNGK